MNIMRRLKRKSLHDVYAYAKYKLNAKKAFRENLGFCNKTDQFNIDDWNRYLGVENPESLFKKFKQYESEDGYAFFPDYSLSMSGDTSTSRDLEFVVNMSIEHKFDVLGSGFKEINLTNSPGVCEDQVTRRKKEMAEQVAKLNNTCKLQNEIQFYSPIDWHLDSKTLKRWPDDKWYTDINPGDLGNSDIKMPWEVSRFHHAGPLGYYAFLNNDYNVAIELQIHILDWIAANKLCRGVNWRNAMEAGIRATNWLFAVSYLWKKNLVEQEFLCVFHKSLYEHAKYISMNIEKNSFGANNHYLCNLLGLIAIGAALPWCQESDKWLLYGRNEISKEMDNQVNSDGSHFEASTFYHRFVTEIFVACHRILTSLPISRKNKLYATNDASYETESLLPERYSQKLFGMIEFIKSISKPGNRMPQIGDNDSGRLFWLPLPFVKKDSVSVNWKLESYADLEGYCNKRLDKYKNTELGWSKKSSGEYESIWFPDFGLGVIKSLRLFLVISCGGNGGYRFGGHAHNDKLSFEMSLDGNDVIVDSGTYVYTSFPEMRNMFRSTISHNTVVFPGLEQNVISDEDLFKLPDKSKAKMDKFGVDFFVGEHIGYGFNCKRTFNISENRLQVKDFTEKPGGYCVLNLHPDVSWKDGILLRSNAIVRLDYNDFSDISVESAQYSPRYGVKVDTQRLVMKRTGKYSTFNLSWN
jgi:hypothetical protein